MTFEEFQNLPPEKAKILNEKYKRARKKFFKDRNGYSGLESLKFRDDFLAKQKA